MGAGGNCPEVREEKLGELVLVGKRAGMGGGERKRGRLKVPNSTIILRSLHHLTLLLCTISCVLSMV